MKDTIKYSLNLYREFFLQLDEANKDMEIMFDYEKEQIIKLKDLIPLW